MGLIKNIKSKTPERDKKIGQITTSLSGAIATILLTVEMPWYAQIVLIVLGSVLGIKSVYHAQKTIK